MSLIYLDKKSAANIHINVNMNSLNRDFISQKNFHLSHISGFSQNIDLEV